MKTVKLDEIVRQRDPELKNVVEQLARGEVGEAIGGLERQGRVHEVKDQVARIDAPHNLITIVRIDSTGQTHERTYDPRRQQGVSIYREQEKALSVGDRIQFTAPANDLKVANRELGTIQSVTDDGRMSLRVDGGRSVSLDPKEYPHFDYGHAVASHSSQGQTADRVLIHIDTELPIPTAGARAGMILSKMLKAHREMGKDSVTVIYQESLCASFTQDVSSYISGKCRVKSVNVVPHCAKACEI